MYGVWTVIPMKYYESGYVCDLCYEYWVVMKYVIIYSCVQLVIKCYMHDVDGLQLCSG